MFNTTVSEVIAQKQLLDTKFKSMKKPNVYLSLYSMRTTKTLL